jgi:uncharacterized membrane protein YgcG
MQHRFEELEATVMKGGEGSTVQLIQTKEEAVADAKASVVRAESHTRVQMELVVKHLRAKQRSTKNATVRRSVDDALAPLEARLQRYTDAAAAAQARRRKQQLKREEAEFQASMNAWVSAGQGDVVEKNFTAVAAWQVNNAHARDVARDKWRLRAKDHQLAAKVRALPPSLQWLGRAAAEVAANATLSAPGVARALRPDDKAARVDRLVELLWDWQADVDVALCDAYECDVFDSLAETVQALDLGAVFLAGRNPAKPMFWGATPPDYFFQKDDNADTTAAVGGRGSEGVQGRRSLGGGRDAAGSGSGEGGGSGGEGEGGGGGGSFWTGSGDMSGRSGSGDKIGSGDQIGRSGRAGTGGSGRAGTGGSGGTNGVSALDPLSGEVAVRPWTPTPFGYRTELRDKRQAMIEAHLLRPELVPDLHTKMRVQALVQELLWRLAELDEEGDTTSSLGEGGDGIGGSQGRGVTGTRSFFSALFGRSRRAAKVAAES